LLCVALYLQSGRSNAMDEEIDITNPDFWGELDAACWKAFEALHNNTKLIGEAARRAPKEKEERVA
jgi:hypothetical protein